MEKKIPRILIGAIKSGSGKTVITCGLLQALKEMGKNPGGFKCGPDYIDPMFHKKILEIPSYNLDAFFLKKDSLREVFSENAAQSQIAVIEGVMGLYDGLGGIQEKGSSYEVAGILETPIVLVVDAHGMGRTILPLLSGMLEYDKEKRIKGVILNRISGSFYQIIKEEIESRLEIKVLGYFPKQEGLQLESRHLGLKMPEEISDLKSQVQKAAAILKETVDLEKILEIAGEAKGIQKKERNKSEKETRVKIAVAKDEVFCFYYEDNLRMLEELGAELVTFSPLKDKELPPDVDGILLGGGYPELKAKELSENESMRKSIKEAIERGMPSVAECGGFMYLHRNICTGEGLSFPMCNVVPEDCFFAGKLVRFGYVTLEEKKKSWSGGKGLPGHEFHYYDSRDNGEDCVAVKPTGKRSWNCVHTGETYWWGFPHLYYPANPAFPAYFVKMACGYKEQSAERKGKGNV